MNPFGYSYPDKHLNFLSTKELPFNSKDKTIKIELIGGDIAV